MPKSLRAATLSSSAAIVETGALAAVVGLAGSAGGGLAVLQELELAAIGIVPRAPPGRIEALARGEAGVNPNHLLLPVSEVLIRGTWPLAWSHINVPLEDIPLP